MFTKSIAVLVLAISTQSTFGQTGCSPQCPPLDAEGNAIEDSLCVGDSVSGNISEREFPICYPEAAAQQPFKFADYKKDENSTSWYITVVSNVYSGCNAGRADSEVFSRVAEEIQAENPNVIFVQSLHGVAESGCKTWASIFGHKQEENAVYTTPLTTTDSDYVIRDALFTSPYPHPSYVILDWDLKLRHKFVGPCCGYEKAFNCKANVSQGLADTINATVTDLLAEMASIRPADRDCNVAYTEWSTCSEACGSGFQTRTGKIVENFFGSGTACPTQLEQNQSCLLEPCNQSCVVSNFTEFSECSLNCGDGNKGFRYKTREIVQPQTEGGQLCPNLTVTEACPGLEQCNFTCVPEFGAAMVEVEIATCAHGLKSVRDLSFSPTPGVHLGSKSEGRTFPTDGEEIWAANGHGHDLTILTGVESSTAEITAMNRKDRGYFHYMANITALAFNKQKNSGRDAGKDTIGYFATCQASNNTYLGTKEPNFFMGPSLYDSRPFYKNLVGQDGGPCLEGDTCYFLHADMLHESPNCHSIAHDPELITGYGTVYWAVDGWNNELVRYDFQQPHGPGLMDHAAAATRRYPSIKVTDGPKGVHGGMLVDGARRILYMLDVGGGRLLAVHIDQGQYVRDARTEYPIFSARVPQFEYSIWACAKVDVLSSTLETPAALAISSDGLRMFVGEYYTGVVKVLDTYSGEQMMTYQTQLGAGLSSMVLSPRSGDIYYANEKANAIRRLEPSELCSLSDTAKLSITNPTFDHVAAGVIETVVPCTPDPSIPNQSLFEQVHGDSGYADSDTSVQDDNVMHAGAAALENRTDCGVDSVLNFDALLLGGYYCHMFTRSMSRVWRPM